MFNEDDSPVGTAGHGMRKYFEQRWAELTEKHEKSSWCHAAGGATTASSEGVVGGGVAPLGEEQQGSVEAADGHRSEGNEGSARELPKEEAGLVVESSSSSSSKAIVAAMLNQDNPTRTHGTEAAEVMIVEDGTDWMEVGGGWFDGMNDDFRVSLVWFRVL